MKKLSIILSALSVFLTAADVTYTILENRDRR